MDNNQNNSGVTEVTPIQYNSVNNQINSYQQNNNIIPPQPPTNIPPTKKSNKLPIIITLVVIIIIVLLGYKFLVKDKTNNHTLEQIKYSTSFFLKNKSGKYALFTDEGQNLTGFVFDYAYEFVNGTTLVRKDKKSGIIDTNGKMIVDFDKYEYLSKENGIYKATTSDNKDYIINSQGKVLFGNEEAQNMELQSSNWSDIYTILKDTKNSLYRILDNEGKTILSFPINSSLRDKPYMENHQDYTLIFYNNKNYIISPIAGQEIISFDSEERYKISYVSDDKQLAIIYSDTQGSNKANYKFIKNGKLYDLSDKCERISISDNNLICENTSEKYLIDDKINIGIKISDKAYKDNNSYVMDNAETFNGVDFYNNNTITKNVSCRVLKDTGYVKSGLYILRTYNSTPCNTVSGTYEYYNSKGENAFGKSFKKAEAFDKNNLAEVSDDGTNYYLIDTTGNKVSQDYTQIYSTGDYYGVKNNGLYGLIDNKGKEIFECLYSRIEISVRNKKSYAIITTNDSKYIIYDLEKKSQIVELSKTPSFSDHYMYLTQNSKMQYYAYNGKLFYEE